MNNHPPKAAGPTQPRAPGEAELAATIEQLQNTLEQLRQEEMNRFLKKASPTAANLLDELTKSLMQKVLSQRVLQLKAACQRGGETSRLVKLLAGVFGLDNSPLLLPAWPLVPESQAPPFQS